MGTAREWRSTSAGYWTVANRTAGRRPGRRPERVPVRRLHRACRPPLHVHRGAGGRRRPLAPRKAPTRQAKPSVVPGLVWATRSSCIPHPRSRRRGRRTGRGKPTRTSCPPGDRRQGDRRCRTRSFGRAWAWGDGNQRKVPLRHPEEYVITYLFRGRKRHMALESKPPAQSLIDDGNSAKARRGIQHGTRSPWRNTPTATGRRP